MIFLAAIDIGSNALRLLLGEFEQGRLSQTHTFREAVRLGQDVFAHGEVGEGRIHEFIGALSRFKRICDEFKVQHLRAVGTSALREARNGPDIVKKVQKEVGLQIELISGEEEARLIVEATHAYFPDVSVVLLIDIGGGSVEVSLVRDNHIVFSLTEKLGAVRLLQLMEKSPEKADEASREFGKQIRAKLEDYDMSDKVEAVMVTGGNAETLAGLKKRLLGSKNTSSISSSELKKIVKEVSSLTFAERITKLGLKPDRADIIVPAGMLLRRIVKGVDVSELLIPRVGLKEGILLHLAAEKLGSFVIDPDI